MIWGLGVPNKIKNFVWRSCRDAVPVKKNLKKRKILQDDTCGHCGQAEELVLHAFWECSKLSLIWDSMLEFSFCQTCSFANIKELFLYVTDTQSKVELMAVIMWNIWVCRNQLRVSNKDHPISQVLPTSQQALADYHWQIVSNAPRLWSHPQTELHRFLHLMVA